jgi:hypothetical protein
MPARLRPICLCDICSDHVRDRVLRIGFIVVFGLMPCGDAAAQRERDARVTPRNARLDTRPTVGDGATQAPPLAWSGQPRDSTVRSTPWSVLASAIVPGTGQALLRQDRLIAYLAVEAYAWARYRADVREGQRARATYRRLASEVARRPFSALRPTGDFEYYERMEKFVESGAFDAVEGGPLDPESDTLTANGAVWLLARQTFWADPSTPPPMDSEEYARAEAFYRERAVGPEYRWSWAGAHLEYSEFRRTIRRSNTAYRTSLQDLGLVIANHALSTVDAFITVRLRRQGTARESQRFELYGSVPIGGPKRHWE